MKGPIFKYVHTIYKLENKFLTGRVEPIVLKVFNDYAMLHCSRNVPFMLMKLSNYARKCA